MEEESFKQITAEKKLLGYVALSANTFPWRYWSFDKLALTMQSDINGNNYGYGYRLELDTPITDLTPDCPAFVVNAILAAMFFRIPCGSSNDPVLLALSAHEISSDSGSATLRFSIETMNPAQIEKYIQQSEREDNSGFWDRRHYSWRFAFRYAEKFGGACSACIITDIIKMKVSLELPVAGNFLKRVIRVLF